MGNYKIISSDEHIHEPEDMWTGRVEPCFKERAPKIVRLEDGSDWWFTDGLMGMTVSALTQTGWRFERSEDLSYFDQSEHIRPGAYDPDERIKDMDMDGIDSSVIYPNQGLKLFAVPDTELLNELCRTYNDWLAEFCSTHPKRLKGVGMINLDDVHWGVNELERCSKMGLVGGLISAYPVPERGYHSAEYEPFWAAAQNLSMPLSLHSGTNRAASAGMADKEDSNRLANRHADAIATIDHWVRSSLAKMILRGVFERYPSLQVGSVEHELSWAPYFMERLDYTYTQRAQLGHWHEYKDDSLPSDYFRRNVFLGFQEDILGVRLRHEIGIDSLQWGSDYPHMESTFPRSRQILDEILSDCSEEEKAKIAGGNGARVYHLN